MYNFSDPNDAHDRNKRELLWKTVLNLENVNREHLCIFPYNDDPEYKKSNREKKE